MSKKLSKEATEALKYASSNYGAVEWTSINTFRIWFTKQNWDRNGGVTAEIIAKEFRVEEL